MARPPQLRKSPRLNDYDYVGTLASHVVLVTRERQPLFADAELAELCLEALEASRRKHDATIHAFCVMPDHVHVLVEMPDSTSLQKFVRLFKQLSGYRLKQATGDFAWQTSYYDHILRREESILDVANYIWENPVEQGLAETQADYAFSGPREFLDTHEQV